MAKRKPEKKREPEGPTLTEALPMQLRIGDRLTDETGRSETARARRGENQQGGCDGKRRGP